MSKTPVVDFFLGALSQSGFAGWFSDLANSPNHTAYLIKAGPGCGKSTFMRHFADLEANIIPVTGQEYVEQIHCSSDPESLDGVVLPSAHALLLDATAPHVVDCKYPGADVRVVSLFDALDYRKITPNKEEILALGHSNSSQLGQAAALFAFGCAILRRQRQEAAACIRKDVLYPFVQRLADSTMPSRTDCELGRVSHRLLSAPTPHGLTVFADSVSALADCIYVLQDSNGAVCDAMMPLLAEHARKNGYDAIVCHCASDQTRIEHLIIPSLRLAFVTSNKWHPLHYPHAHLLYASRFRTPLPQSVGYRREQQALVRLLFRRTAMLQRSAKATHDLLERYYVAASDFGAVNQSCAALQQELYD